MERIGIICEYNPLHSGHIYHIASSRELAGDDAAVVCVMSGNFVQRGSIAVYPKHLRAKAAILSGADLVLELPAPWALSSAEGFARGAVGILNSLGCVTRLSFGSERGNLAVLAQIAEALLDPGMDERIRAQLKSGVSYAKARQSALGARHDAPNDILAVEYIKAIKMLGSDILPIAVPRAGASHDSGEVPQDGGHLSASAIRSALKLGQDVSEYIPHDAAVLFEEQPPVFDDDLDTAVLSRLRMLPKAAFDALPGASEGLSDRLYRFSRSEGSVMAIADAVKTKRYAHSRIRRMLTCAAIGITREMSEGLPPYARVLAANGRGRVILRGVKQSIPVIVKPAAAKRLPPYAREIFEVESAATDLHVLAYKDEQMRKGGQEWTTSPVIL